MSDTEGKGATNRAAYMKSLKEKLAPITTEEKDNTKPFTMSRMRKVMSIRAMTGVSLPLWIWIK